MTKTKQLARRIQRQHKTLNRDTIMRDTQDVIAASKRIAKLERKHKAT